MRVQLEKEAALESAVLELESTFLFKGGEAAIYALPGRDALVAKVYHKPIAQRAEKLAAMIAAPPVDPMAAHGHASIAWPLDRLLAADDRRFVGFVMPRVHNARPIFEFYNPRARLKQCPLFHYGYLVRTARNLAAAVRALHERGYVIGDVNESNLLVTNTALVTLVDTDSFQVPDNGRVHRCLVGKPEYTPPELQNSRFADFDRGPEHDAFALAVLIFQLLMQGMHPFNGMFTGQGDPAPLGKRIHAGHFPYVRGRKVPYGPNPHAPPYAVLPPPVQELMFQCFEEGHARSAIRPNAARWQEVLKDAERLLTVCSVNRQHVYHKGFDGCPWCELSLRHGRDPFPSPEEALARRADTQTATDAPEATPTGSSGPGTAGPTPTSPTRATTPSKATVKPRRRTATPTMQQITAIPTDPNIPIDVLPAAAPVGEPFAFVEVTLVEPEDHPEERRRHEGPRSPLVQFLLNPAFWLITPAVFGLLLLLLAILHARAAKRERDNAPPATTKKEPESTKDEPGKEAPDKQDDSKKKGESVERPVPEPVQVKEGFLVVEVNEPRPEVLVDGVKVHVNWDSAGKKAELALRPGTRRVEVRKSGFTSYGEQVGIVEGKRHVLTAKLMRPVPEGHAVEIFNGKDLTGWEGLPGYWHVEEGAIVGRCPPGKRAHTFLVSKKTYKDFDLKFQVRRKDGIGNSGVQFRSQIRVRDRFAVVGPQCEIDSANFGWPPGSLVTEPTARPLAVKARAEVARAYKDADFNDFHIRCVGKHVTIKVNDVIAVDGDFPSLPDDGIIAWQIHGSRTPKELTFRNIVFTDLSTVASEDGFVPLFNGKDLTGWGTHSGRTGQWKVQDSMIVSGGPASYLFSRDAYQDFHLRAEVQVNDHGNSGIFFRALLGIGIPKGYEAQINATHPDAQKTGSLYNIVKVTEQLHKPGEWFTLEVIADGDHIIIKVNSKTVVDTHEKKYIKGYIALQQHNPATVVKFRKIEIKELKSQ
jgi:hypothetical protein